MEREAPLFPPSFRKMSITDRREWLAANREDLYTLLLAGGEGPGLLELVERMVENGIGTMPVPLGIAPGFIINGKNAAIPLATEEPSVIAAASFGAKLASAGGGFEVRPPRARMESLVYLDGVDAGGKRALEALGIDRLRETHRAAHPSLYARGGGLETVGVSRLPETGVVRVVLGLHVCDAMGANIANTAAEALAPLLEAVSGGRRVMAILSNAMPDRIGSAACRVPLRRLARNGLDGRTMGRRIELACRIAEEDPSRAVTHNKGIMNGITALALATGNDTRGLEAAVYHHAQGRPLSHFRVEKGHLIGEIALPLPLGTVGGAVSVHPAARFSLGVLGNPDAAGLAGVALALGLAQNLAALAALVGEGIQEGHMRLHARRLSGTDADNS